VRDGGREFTSCVELAFVKEAMPRTVRATGTENTYPWTDRDPGDEESA
jgi:hypothetical protein